MQAIQVIDITPLAEPPSRARDLVDAAIGRAGETMGFLALTGAPVERVTEPKRLRSLLEVFALDEERKMRLARKRHRESNPNRYRGYFPFHDDEGALTTEGFDLGSDWGAEFIEDPLIALFMERNAWPEEEWLPGFRALAREHYRDLEAIGHLIMESLARYLGQEETYFRHFFNGGASTLRFLRKPPRDDLSPSAARYTAEIDGQLTAIGTPAHRDSGVLTLLWQNAVGGLQAEAPDGRWLDVPTMERGLAINFGDCMTFWTSGRLRATPHRVVARREERFSIPFFFEPAHAAEIAPIDGGGESVRYVDHMFEKIQGFRDLAGLRPRD